MTTRVSEPAGVLEDRVNALLRLLSQGPRPTSELLSELGVSQPTLSRTIQAAGPQVRMFRQPGVRTPQYARVRASTGVPSPQPIFFVSEEGSIEEIGTVSFLAGGGSLVDTARHGRQLYAGLPPEMAFAAPSGFLGRQVAQQVSQTIDVPPTLRDWSDDHRALYLCTFGDDAPSALIFGHKALSRHMEQRKTQPVAERDLPALYQQTATAAIQTGYGSSAGGEQPKFTCESAGRGHLMVKFARASTRAADLLFMEDLALAALGETGMTVAKANAIQANGLVFLEIERFDRVGRFGRRSFISAGALDDELFGRRDRWTDFALRCQQARLLEPAAVDVVHILSAFCELIGNSDTHFDNLSLWTGPHGQPTGVAPAYDMLPMRYAPIGGGIDPELRPIRPSIEHIGARPFVWERAYDAAARFWDRAHHDARLSPAMREISQANLAVVREFVAPLAPISAATPAALIAPMVVRSRKHPADTAHEGKPKPRVRKG